MARSAWWLVVAVACVAARAHGQGVVQASGSWWVHASPDTELSWPSVTCVSEGFVAACVRLTSNGSDLLVVAADGAGTVLGDPRVVAHSSDRSGIGAPALAGLGHGCALVWEESSGSSSAVRLVHLARDGTPVDAPRTIGEDVVRSRPLAPRIAGAQGGPPAYDVLVAWTDWLVDPPIARAAWVTRDGLVARAFTIRGGDESVTGPDVATGDAGVTVAWIQGEFPSRVMTARIAPGDTVLHGQREISDDAVHVRRTWVRLGGRAAGVTATWCEADGPRLVVRARSLTRGGEANPILTPGLPDDGHEIAPSCAGGSAGILCAWEGGGAPGPRVYARWIDRDGVIDREPIVLSSAEAHSPALAQPVSPGAASACVWAERERPVPRSFGLRALVTGSGGVSSIDRSGGDAWPPGAAGRRQAALSIHRRGSDMSLEIHEGLDAGDRVALVRLDGRRVGREIAIDRAMTGAAIDIVGDLEAPARVALFAVVRTRRGVLACRVPPLLAGPARPPEIGYFRR